MSKKLKGYIFVFLGLGILLSIHFVLLRGKIYESATKDFFYWVSHWVPLFGVFVVLGIFFAVYGIREINKCKK